MDEFAGKAVLVTGGAKGLGAEMARRFATGGAQVTIGDVERPAGEAVAAAIGGEFRHLDVSSQDDWLTMMEGRKLDILVNNAGIFVPDIPLAHMSLEIWQRHFRVNLDGAFLGCKLGLKAMAARGGSIVNVASTLAIATYPGSAAYSTSKAAILMLTRHAAREGAHSGVRVNAVLPGAVLTDQSRASIPAGWTEQQFVEAITSRYPMGRIGQPSEIADAVLYLCSPRSSFVTGAFLNVDGGERC